MKQLLVLLGIVFVFSSFSQNLELRIGELNSIIKNYEQKIDSLKSNKEELMLDFLHQQIINNALPELNLAEELIEHRAYCLVYSEKHEQAKWVSHIISTEIKNGSVGRTNDFRVDPLIKTGSAQESDYFTKEKINGKTKYHGFGYDRGHLAPSADFKWSKIALSESYYYSNMSPQLAKFNRVAWAKLEGLLRNYVNENNVQLFVITGPVLTDNLKPIPLSKNQLSVPRFFYKIAFDKVNQRAVCFLLPHKELEYPIEYYAISIDSLELVTGINFFPSLDDNLENKIESQTDYKAFLPKKNKSDIVPMRVLPKNCFNTVQARKFVDTGNKVTVCGTVVSSHKSKKGHVFLNLDKNFPNQIFSITIWSTNIVNFSFNPVSELTGKRICVKGKIVNYKGTPSVYIDNEKQIEILE